MWRRLGVDANCTDTAFRNSGALLKQPKADENRFLIGYDLLSFGFSSGTQRARRIWFGGNDKRLCGEVPP